MIEKYHGDDIKMSEKLYGIKIKEDTVFLSHNINHFDMDLNLYGNLNKLISDYPDKINLDIINLLTDKKKLNFNNVALTNGASEAFYIIASFFQNKNVAIIEPTYSGYAEAFNGHSVKIKKIEIGVDYNINKIDLSKFDNIDAVVVCNPNNPTGTFQNLENLLVETDKRGIYLIVDESFIKFTNNEYSLLEYVKKYKKLVVVESSTKIYKIAGVRFGAIYACEDIIDMYKKRIPPWNINNIALEVVSNKLLDKNLINNTIKELKKEKQYLIDSFNALKIPFKMGSANFYLIETLDDKMLIKSLLEGGILVRTTRNFVGLDGKFIRVAVGNHRGNKMLIKLLKEVYI